MFSDKHQAWPIKYFKKIDDPFFNYGIGAIHIAKEGEDVKKDYLYIIMPKKNDIKTPIPLRLDLLDSGISYTNKNGEVHWSWNHDPKDITLYGSIGENSLTPHCWIRDNNLILID